MRLYFLEAEITYSHGSCYDTGKYVPTAIIPAKGDEEALTFARSYLELWHNFLNWRLDYNLEATLRYSQEHNEDTRQEVASWHFVDKGDKRETFNRVLEMNS